MFSSDSSVGASTADFGIYTGLLAIIFVNWSAFDRNEQLEQLRCCLVFIIIFILMINLMSSLGPQNSGVVDINGHVGGMITGLLWGLAFFPRVRSPSGLTQRKWGIVLLGIFFSV